ncbi:MAG: bifunctional oligoribonuclease/PAP phosphatase NrnA [Acidobacteriota bacterium]
MINEIKKKIIESKRIAISSHIRPDADCVGSGLALMLMLKQLGKDVSYRNIDIAPFPISAFPSYDSIEHKQIYPDEFDLLLLIEGGSEERCGQKNLDKYFTINIDHHATSSMESNINWIDPEASAVGELVYELGVALEIEFTKEIGFNLYAAISSDTGSFKYSNTTFKSLNIASEIVKRSNISPHDISDLIFNSNPVEKIQLLQKILSTLDLEENGKIAVINFRKDFLSKSALEHFETEDIISIVRSIRGVVVTLFFKEIKKDYYRISVRSKGSFSSSEMAKHFDGGGHDHAAGFFFPGNFSDAKKSVIEFIKKQLK